ncbi:MAG TPA: SHOCT domain-containing protein [Actinobacteria bacterium]|nr:SHOCT domain-containing protein [Actinomycetota bacterium]
MMWGPWMGFGGLWMLLIVVGIVLLVIWAARGVAEGGGSGASSPKRALEILDERFARGEIDEEEYRTRRRLLEQS